MADETIPELADFRNEAIHDLQELKKKYVAMISASADESIILERAARLLPGIIKAEENLLTSVEESERRRKLEEGLEPLFVILQNVLGNKFLEKRDEIIAALEAELK